MLEIFGTAGDTMPESPRSGPFNGLFFVSNYICKIQQDTRTEIIGSRGKGGKPRSIDVEAAGEKPFHAGGREDRGRIECNMGQEETHAGTESVVVIVDAHLPARSFRGICQPVLVRGLALVDGFGLKLL